MKRTRCNFSSKEVQKSVGYLQEHNPLYLDLYVREYLAFNADLHKVAKSRIDEVIVFDRINATKVTKKMENYQRISSNVLD